MVQFQGQFMSSADLKRFFSRYVTGAHAGDDAVAAWVGPHKESPRGIEARAETRTQKGCSSLRPPSRVALTHTSSHPLS